MTIVKNHQGGLQTRPDKFEILFAIFAFCADNTLNPLRAGRDRPLRCVICTFGGEIFVRYRSAGKTNCAQRSIDCSTFSWLKPPK